VPAVPRETRGAVAFSHVLMTADREAPARPGSAPESDLSRRAFLRAATTAAWGPAGVACTAVPSREQAPAAKIKPFRSITYKTRPATIYRGRLARGSLLSTLELFNTSEALVRPAVQVLHCSTLSSGTPAKCLKLFVTKVACSATAWHAMSRSMFPIGVPRLSSFARMRA
jgi:hypothetical protein